MEEIWKDIPGYEGKYQVSSFGRVKRLAHYDTLNRYWEEYITDGFDSPKSRNYVACKVNLSLNGKNKQVYVSHLVAEAFIPNPDNKPEVDHIDTNPKNNCAWNLRWVTKKENSNNPLTKIHQRNAAQIRVTQYPSPNKGKASPNRKKIIQKDLKGNIIKIWDCIRLAAEILDIPAPNISECVNNHRKTAGGYIWQRE